MNNTADIRFEKYSREIGWWVSKVYPKLESIQSFIDEEDVYQEGCISFLKALRSYNSNRSTFSTYLYCVLMSRFMDMYRFHLREIYNNKVSYLVQESARSDTVDMTVDRIVYDEIRDVNLDLMDVLGEEDYAFYQAYFENTSAVPKLPVYNRNKRVSHIRRKLYKYAKSASIIEV